MIESVTINYIREIKLQFRDVYHFTPDREQDGEPCYDAIPDGVYPMTIEGKLDNVKVVGNRIFCCRYESTGTKPVTAQ